MKTKNGNVKMSGMDIALEFILVVGQKNSFRLINDKFTRAGCEPMTSGLMHGLSGYGYQLSYMPFFLQ